MPKLVTGRGDRVVITGIGLQPASRIRLSLEISHCETVVVPRSYASVLHRYSTGCPESLLSVPFRSRTANKCEVPVFIWVCRTA